MPPIISSADVRDVLADLEGFVGSKKRGLRALPVQFGSGF